MWLGVCVGVASWWGGGGGLVEGGGVLDSCRGVGTGR